MPTKQTIYLRHGGQVPESQTGLEVASVRMPRYGRIRGIHAFARAVANTVTIDVQKNGTTILTGAITPIAGDQVAGSLDGTQTAFAIGDEIQVLVNTSSASTLDDGGVSLDIG